MKKTLKIAISILLICTMALALFACTKKDTPATPGGTATPAAPGGSAAPDSPGGSDAPDAPIVPSRDTINIALSQDGGTLDPFFMLATDIQSTMSMVYEGLYYYNSAGEVIWLLATSIDFIEPQKWQIHLREGVKFSNGADFDAEDVMFSINKANHREGEPAMVPDISDELSKILDPYTIELAFSTYNIGSITALAGVCIFDKETYNPDTVSTTPVGTGPYVVESYVVNSHLFLTLRDGYWGATPPTKNFHFLQLKEESQRVNAVETGEVDIASIPFQDIGYVQSLPNVALEVKSIPQTKAMFFSLAEGSPFYDNLDARMAVAYAIDRDAIIKLVYNSYVEKSRASAAFSSVDVEDRFLDLGIYAEGYNPERAKELAISSGLVNKEIRLVNNGNSDEVLMCELIQANLKSIGVSCSIHNYDMGTWTTIIFDGAAFDLASNFTGNATASFAGNFNSWIRFGGGATYLDNPWPGRDRAIELVMDILTIPDAAVRSERNMELTTLTNEGMLWYNITDDVNAYAVATGIKGDARNQGGTMFYWSNLYWE